MFMKKLIIIYLLLILPFPVFAGSIEDEINQQRKENNLKVLMVEKSLINTAKFKVNDMIFHKYFAHINPFGDSLFNIFERFKIKYSIGGEILAKKFNGDGLIKAWMDSPKHKDVILDVNFYSVGCYQKEGLTACHFKR